MLMNKYYLHTAEAKVKMVQKYLENLLESVEEEKKILFFAHHKCLLHAAVETMEKTKTKFIHIDGETPSGLRQGLVDSFQRDANSPKVAILSIKAAGVGLTLTRASLVVFSEYSWTPAEILQAEDRAHRIGQRDSVLVQFLHAKDSVDDIIWQSVQNKLENLGRFLDGTRKGNKMETKIEDINAPDRRQSFDASQKTLHEFVSRS
jgi:SWI/SNF-related matrix-associated actin-dependent regulator 1 of chromatin subfamily A